MKQSTVFSKAARAVSTAVLHGKFSANPCWDAPFSCHSIEAVLKDKSLHEVAKVQRFYRAHCGPLHRDCSTAWFGRTTAYVHKKGEVARLIKNQDKRVFALLLAREVALDEEGRDK